MEGRSGQGNLEAQGCGFRGEAQGKYDLNSGV